MGWRICRPLSIEQQELGEELERAVSHKEPTLLTVGNWEPRRALSREGTKLDLKYRKSALLQRGDSGGGGVGVKMEEEE